MSIQDPILSDPPSDDELMKRLEIVEIVVDELDRETAYTVIMALQGQAKDDYWHRTDSFRRQLSYRLDQARIRADR